MCTKTSNTDKAVAVELIELPSGKVVQIFSQLTECANSLGMSLLTVYYRVQKSKEFQFSNKIVYLRYTILIDCNSLLSSKNIFHLYMVG